MKLLEEHIKLNGEFRPGGIVKVDNFLNHLMDTNLIKEIGKEFFRLFGDKNITKILTVEASGIGIACIAAIYFDVPVLFAKKTQSKNIDTDNLYTAKVHSFTKGIDNTIRVDKRYITSDDRVLIIDDFLANGEALLGLKSIVDQSGATLCGAGICIEKAFQPGGDIIRGMGVDLRSLAIIDVNENDDMIFLEK